MLLQQKILQLLLLLEPRGLLLLLLAEDVGLLGAQQGGQQLGDLRVGGEGGGRLGDGGERGGGGDGHRHVLHHGLRTELRGGDHLGGALHQGGGHLLAPEGDGDDGGLLGGDGGDVGAGVGHLLGHLSLGHGHLGRQQRVGLERVGAAAVAQQELLEEAVEELVLVHWLHQPGADSLHIVDCCWHNVREGCSPTTNSRRCEGDTCGLGGSQGVEQNLLNAGLRGEGVGVGVDDGAVVDVGGLEGRHRHHLQAGTGGQDVSHLGPAELDDRNFSGNWNLMSHSDEIRNPILGRLKVCILIIIIIVIVIVYDFAPSEQVVSC